MSPSTCLEWHIGDMTHDKLLVHLCLHMSPSTCLFSNSLSWARTVMYVYGWLLFDVCVSIDDCLFDVCVSMSFICTWESYNILFICTWVYCMTPSYNTLIRECISYMNTSMNVYLHMSILCDIAWCICIHASYSLLYILYMYIYVYICM